VKQKKEKLMGLPGKLMKSVRPWLIDAGRGTRKIRMRVKAGLGRLGPLEIIDYYGYGSREQVRIKGRVVEKKSISAVGETGSVFGDILNTYRRFTQMPIPGARVSAVFNGTAKEESADKQGFFQIAFRPGAASGDGLWQPLQLKLLTTVSSSSPSGKNGWVLIPPEKARHVVVSDIDDTVLPTQATNFLRMMHSLFLENAHTRLPFPGVAAFYRALHLGADDAPSNPIFYVSRGPWNLYDLLHEFFHLHDIPVGPVLNLRDWGLSMEGMTPARPRGHKFQLIMEIFETYPHLPFILIGDSGQLDPEIYQEVVKKYPDRVKAVYIRKVAENAARNAELENLSRELEKAGSPLVITEDTMEMARHAVSAGFIEERRLDALRSEMAAGEGPPGLAAEPPA
jgi:phosphatidate phosphatase APP1